ncbi:MAG: tetratricopeptide repeat protein [Prevotellaceae bacterium]|nr:tetratricopeptide repeat protein [Candidatus Colivivens equi]
MKKFVYTFIFICTLGLGACHNGARKSVAKINDADTTTLKLCLDSATVLFQNGDYEQSLDMAKQALEIGRVLKDTVNIADALSYVLSDYQQLGVLDSAITTARELIELDKIDGDAELLSNDYNNLAYIYMGNKQYDLAREFIEKAIGLEMQVEGSPRIATRYGMASEIYLNLSNDSTCKNSDALRERALNFINKAFALEASRNDTLRMGRRLSQKADILTAMHQYAEAEQNYMKSLAYHEPINERHSLGITYRQLGILYLLLQKPQQAIPYLEKSVEITRSENELASLMKVYQKLHEAYKTVDEKKAYEYLTLYTQAKDSIYTLESARSLSEFHARYDTDKEKENAEAKRTQLIITWIVGTVALLFFILLVVYLYIKSRRRKRHTAELRKQVVFLKQQMQEQEEKFQQIIRENEASEKEPINAENADFIEKLNAAIFTVMGSKEVTAENVASELCITSQQLRRKIKSIKNVTSVAYINSIRIDYARLLLKERYDLTIEQVGMLCGYDEATHFTRSFKKETGMTPSLFREENIK